MADDDSIEQLLTTPSIQASGSDPQMLLMNIGNINLLVKQGDITKETSDAIVNSTNHKLDLSRGQVSQAILEEAGDGIQQDVNQDGLSNDIVVSGPGKLLCKRIIHLVAPSYFWSSWKTATKKVLEKAESLRCKSLSIPALGTGQKKKSPSTMAKNMIDAIIEFEKESQNQNLTLVSIVIFQPEMVSPFHDEMWNKMEDIKNKGYIKRMTYDTHGNIVEATDSQKLMMTIGDIFLEVREGDITKESTDGIVNSSNKKLDLSRGEVSQAILKEGGKEIQKQCNDCRRQGIPDGIAVTGPGRLPCKHIIHMVGPSKIWSWKTPTRNVLEKAERMELKSLAFPALGTGRKGIPPSTIAPAIIDAIEEFEKEKRPYHLRRIYIIVFQPKMVSVFHKEMHRRVDASDHKSYLTISSRVEEAEEAENETSLINGPPKCAPKSRASCLYRDLCKRFKETLELHNKFFNPNFDMCYCNDCHKYRKDEDYYSRGKPPKDYGLPIGWCRFALSLSARTKLIAEDWHRAYHGTTRDNVANILDLGILMPGDVALGGFEISERPGHFNDTRKPEGFDTKKVFVSPSILYVDDDTYAESSRFIDPKSGKYYEARVAFQVFICPGSYDVSDETIGAEKQIDPKFPNDELEWSTKQRGSIRLYGLLIKISEN